MKNIIARLAIKKRRRVLLVVVAVLVSLLGLVGSSGAAHAQAPPNDRYVNGPWLSMFQFVWVTDPDYTNSLAGDDDYVLNIGQRYKAPHLYKRQCYPGGGLSGDNGPEADQTNSIYLMMQCRIGKVVGVLTWSAVGIAFMAMAWNGFMHVIDSTEGDERSGQLRNAITGPIVGLALVFMAYIIAKALYAVMRYNFETYLNNPSWWG